jgi:hypothetical protein
VPAFLPLWTPKIQEIGCPQNRGNFTHRLERLITIPGTDEQGFRACVGVLRLVKTHGRERLEAACSRALEIGARSYSSVNSIPKNNRDRQRAAKPADGPAIAHDNIRGPTNWVGSAKRNRVHHPAGTAKVIRARGLTAVVRRGPVWHIGEADDTLDCIVHHLGLALQLPLKGDPVNHHFEDVVVQ